MKLWTLAFGKRPSSRLLPRLEQAPADAVWRLVRPKPDAPVRAELARSSGKIDTPRGALRYQAGKHYIVHYSPGDRAPVHRTVFERTYVRRDDGLYEKRTDIVLRYFRLPHPVMIESLEGDELAQPGDWIMEGAAGELWPVAAADAEAKYQRLDS